MGFTKLRELVLFHNIIADILPKTKRDKAGQDGTADTQRASVDIPDVTPPDTT